MMQPFRGVHEFLGQAKIDEIAGHGNVVGRLLGDVGGDEIEDLAPVHEFPPAMPIDVAEHALAHQLAAFDPRHRAKWMSERWARVNTGLLLGRGCCWRLSRLAE